MSTEEVVTDLINEQSDRADEALQSAIEYGDLAQTAAIGGLILNDPPQVIPPEVDIPLPSPVDGGAEWQINYGNAFADLGPQFTTAWNNFITTFFPEIDGCLKTTSDAWICNTIENGGTGIPAAVEDALWQRGREREGVLAAMQSDSALNEWAGRGFSLPSGVVTYKLALVQQDHVNKISTFNRDVAIKQADIEIENIRFAIQQAVALRLGAINAAVAYIQAFFLPHKLAVERANGVSDAKYKFYASTATYYNAIIAAARMEVDAGAVNAKAVADNNMAIAAYAVGNTKARVDAAVGSATALGRAAAAGLGSVNTLANLANITTQEGA